MDPTIFLVGLLILKLVLDFSPLGGSHYASYIAYGLICIAAAGIMLFQYPHAFVGYFSGVIGVGFFIYGVYKWQIRKHINSDSAESSKK